MLIILYLAAVVWLAYLIGRVNGANDVRRSRRRIRARPHSRVRPVTVPNFPPAVRRHMTLHVLVEKLTADGYEMLREERTR